MTDYRALMTFNPIIVRFKVHHTGEAYRTIGAKVGSALLYIVFSQNTFANIQTDLGRIIEDSHKIYAKVATRDSLTSMQEGKSVIVNEPSSNTNASSDDVNQLHKQSKQNGITIDKSALVIYHR